MKNALYRNSNLRSSAHQFRPDIAGLRALAILFVTLFHYDMPGFHGGFIGVDVFFVISGYLMTKIIIDKTFIGRFYFIEFYAARFRRIAPPLAVMILFTIIFGFFFIDPIEYKILSEQSLSGIFFYSNFKFFIESGYFSPKSDKIWLLHTWSLSVEWQFYLIYPIIIRFLSKAGRENALFLILFVTVSLWIADFSVHFFYRPKFVSFLFYMFPARAPEMTSGGIVYLLEQRGIRVSRQWGLEAIGIIALVGCASFYTSDMLWPGIATIIPVAATMMILLANRGESSLIGKPVFLAIGRWSYSIYLWHWPIMVGALSFGISGYGASLILISMSIAAGAFSYRFVETPLGELSPERWLGISRRLKILFFGLVAAAMSMRATDGMPGRHANGGADMIYRAESARSEKNFPPKCDGTLCTLTTGFPTKVLIVGDSHALMWFSALGRAGHTKHISIDILATAGCVPIPGIIKPSNPTCARSNDAITRLIDSRLYDRIVFIAAWNEYLQPHADTNICVATPGGCKPIENRQASNSARGALTRIAMRALSTRARVVLLSPAPVAPFDVPAWISKHVFAEGPSAVQALRSFPKSRMLTSDNSFGSELDSLSRNGVLIANPSARLCSATNCRLVTDNGDSLYKDNNHLREFVIEMLPVDWLCD